METLGSLPCSQEPATGWARWNEYLLHGYGYSLSITCLTLQKKLLQER